MTDLQTRIAWVRQEDASGCAVATVAMLLGRTYRDVQAEINDAPAGGASTNWTTTGITHYAIDWMLARHGAFIQRRYPSWGWAMEAFAERHYAIVLQSSGRSHVVAVCGDGGVLDPARRGVFDLADWPKVQQLVGVAWPAGGGRR